MKSPIAKAQGECCYHDIFGSACLALYVVHYSQLMVTSDNHY
jgi:hypothetical protein